MIEYDIFLKKCSNCGKDIIRKEKSKSGLYFRSMPCKSKKLREKGMVKCVVCEKDFYKPPAEIKRYPIHCCSVECRAENNKKQETKVCDFCGEKIIKPQSLFKNRKNFFCSESCHNKWQSKKEIVKCDCCEKRFEKQLSLINRSRSNFCSISCKSKSVAKMSYVENEFEEIIKNTGLKYERNNRDIVRPLELDFWLPEIKYAIEINGIFHYKPIFGEGSLVKIKSRDKRKKIKCKALGIKLRVVKPGNSKNGTRQRRFERVLWELKQRAKEFGYNV